MSVTAKTECIKLQITGTQKNSLQLLKLFCDTKQIDWFVWYSHHCTFPCLFRQTGNGTGIKSSRIKHVFDLERNQISQATYHITSLSLVLGAMDLHSVKELTQNEFAFINSETHPHLLPFPGNILPSLPPKLPLPIYTPFPSFSALAGHLQC